MLGGDGVGSVEVSPELLAKIVSVPNDDDDDFNTGDKYDDAQEMIDRMARANER
eukprot:CAMPEP_0198134132 /NCGR_PEP_ID=MMETSP1442-20131203/59920_1 /TAXON_ID= /ORGANISM="Craspedostauros australis, Strain CCMP3328" /LENGTH=53 /DNA_ID=CAMNT_0043795271 /DNA_START=833 /DNA_END=994 /DNA_ORIENTATION=-